MSMFSNLFQGSTDSSVSKLFDNKADGPVGRDSLRNTRTIIDIKYDEKKKKSKRQKKKEQEELERRLRGEPKKDEAEQDKDEQEDAEEDEEDDNSDDDEEDVEGDADEDADEDGEKEETRPSKSKKKDEFENLERDYYEKVLKETTTEKESEEKEESDEKESEEKEEYEENKNSKESEDTKKDEKKTSKASAVDLKESELDKAERTVFVGNVPKSVATTKKLERQFKQLFAAFGKLDSVRFRSISFDQNIPRKLAFAAKAIHTERDSINAYVVYEDRAASRKAVDLNGTVFEDCHLRVDHVAHPQAKVNKRSVFVGNLDYVEQEESLWHYFNKLTDNDVESVRIIRDSATNLGKGFAYVQFKDTLSVTKAVAANDKPLQYASGKSGRKLRVVRTSAKAKPSLWSPNHIDNMKKSHMAQKLNESQRTKLGRAQSILGKADRSTAGKTVIEGERARKGDKIAGIKGLKGQTKKPRIRERSTKYKEAKQETLDEMTKAKKEEKEKEAAEKRAQVQKFREYRAQKKESRDRGDEPREKRPRDDRSRSRDGKFDRSQPRDGEFDRKPRDGKFDRKPRDGKFDRKPRDGKFDGSKPREDREDRKRPREEKKYSSKKRDEFGNKRRKKHQVQETQEKSE